jgi:hypothetical protein
MREVVELSKSAYFGRGEKNLTPTVVSFSMEAVFK